MRGRSARMGHDGWVDEGGQRSRRRVVKVLQPCNTHSTPAGGGCQYARGCGVRPRDSARPPTNTTAVDDVIRMAAGGLVSAGVAAVARRHRALRGSGAWAATVLGTILALAGWAWLGLVGVFFVSASILTKLDTTRGGRTIRSTDREGRRWQQVAANGILTGAAALVYVLTRSPLAFTAAAGAIAAATADTWATEIGRWSRTPPRLVTTGAPVPAGQSGGITAIGTLGSVAGALLIAVATVGLAHAAHSVTLAPPVRLAGWVAIAGVTGSLFDSVLGATVEERWRWLGNDGVNVAATAWGAGVMLLGVGVAG